MLIYATPEQLRDFMHGEGSTQEPPADAQLLLRKASQLVAEATRGATYTVTSDDLPSDPDVARAFREATCSQAEAWSINGITPGSLASRPQRVASKSLGGASVSYESDGAATAAANALASGEELVGDARRILSDAGLISNQVNPSGRVGAAYIGGWPVDLNTGRLIGPGDAAIP